MSVIIIGGGMTGATLALALSHFSQGKLAVHLVEARVPCNQHPGFDARAIALAEGTCQQLARIGVWPALADGACAIRRVHVSEQRHASFVTINASDYQLEALGQVVELYEVGQRLFTLLRQASGVTLHCPARVSQVQRYPDQVSVLLDNGTTLYGQLLVAADGSGSAVASQCGIEWRQWLYPQQAVIASIGTQLPHQGQAFERFTAAGPLALLPLTADAQRMNRCSLVWCMPAEQQQQMLACSDHQFCQALQQAFGWRLGRLHSVGCREHYPLALSMAMRTFSHRLALVGNAAQTLHPVAGQGFNLGMRDVISLAQTLHVAASQQQDIGAYPLLRAWQQRRETDRNATITLTDGLIRLFANHWQPLVPARNMALLAFNLIAPLRDRLVHRALGWVAY